jgi:hypothetical protein
MQQQYLQLSINGESGGFHNLHLMQALTGGQSKIVSELASSADFATIMKAAMTAMTEGRKDRITIIDPHKRHFTATRLDQTTSNMRTRVQALSIGLTGSASRPAPFVAAVTPIRATAVKSPTATRTRRTTASASTATTVRRPRRTTT